MISFKKLLLGVLAAAILASAPMGVSSANAAELSPVPASVSTGHVQVDSPAEDDSDAVSSATNDLTSNQNITINRWKDAASGFSSNLGGFDMQNASASVSREVLQGGMMSAGNMSWDFTLNLTSFASSVSLFTGMVYYVDLTAAQIFQVFTGQNGGMNLLGIVAVIALLAVMIGAVRQFRGKQLWSRAISILLMSALLWVTVAGLLSAAGPINKTPDTYTPPALTPSWAVTKLLEGINSASNLTTAVLINTTSQETLWGGERADQTSCGYFIDGMEQRMGEVVDGAGDGSGESYQDLTETQRAQVVRNYQMRAVVDRLWQQSGLRTWVDAQFGTGSEYRFDVFCYHLDQRSGSVTPTRAMVTANFALNHRGIETLPTYTEKANNSSVFNPKGNAALFGSTIGWAACEWDGSAWKISEAWKGFNNSDEQSVNLAEGAANAITNTSSGGVPGGLTDDSTCAAWASADQNVNWATDEKLRVFHMPGNQAAINIAASSGAGAGDVNAVSDFISSFVGTGAGAGVATTTAYALLSPVGTAPIILFSLAKLVFDLILVFSVVMLLVMIPISMFSKNPWGEKLLPVARQVVVTAFMTVGIGMALSLLLVFSYAIASLGAGVSGAFGGLFLTVWATISPMLALLAMSFLWKKAFKAPNPFTIKGAAAWAKAAPVGVAAVGGGMVGKYIGSRKREIADRAKKGITGAVTGNQKNGDHRSRKSSMSAGDVEMTVPGAGKRSKGRGQDMTPEMKEAQKQAKVELRKSRSMFASTRNSVISGSALGSSAITSRSVAGRIHDRVMESTGAPNARTAYRRMATRMATQAAVIGGATVLGGGVGGVAASAAMIRASRKRSQTRKASVINERASEILQEKQQLEREAQAEEKKAARREARSQKPVDGQGNGKAQAPAANQATNQSRARAQNQAQAQAQAQSKASANIQSQGGAEDRKAKK